MVHKPLISLLAIFLLAGCTGKRPPAPTDPRDAQLRDASRQIADLQSRNVGLPSDVQRAREELADAQRETQELRHSVASAREALSSAKEETVRAHHSHAALRTENDSLARRTDVLAGSVERMRSQLAARARELADRDDRLARLQRHLAMERSSNRSLEGLLASLRENRNDLMARLDALGESKRVWIAVLGTLLLLMAALAAGAYWTRRPPGGSDTMRLRVRDEARP